MLPLSRNANHPTGTPIAGHTIDDIQDNIIAAKHGAIVLAVSGAAFAPHGYNPATSIPWFGDDWQFYAPPNNLLKAPLVLPIGTRIKTITWHFSKAGSASTLSMSIRRRNGTVSNDVDVLNDSSSGAAYTSTTRSPNYLIVPGDVLHLVVNAGAVAHRFSHAFLTITKE